MACSGQLEVPFGAMRKGRRVNTQTDGDAKPASWQTIHDGLLGAILRHRLAPGAKLVEEDIAELYGVSRTVVRAALQALARDGLVALQRNKGASVAHPTPEEARQIFEARALIEPHLVAMAVRRAQPSDLAALEASVHAEHASAHRHNPREAVYHSADFHRRIASMADHAVLAGILGELLSRSSLVISLYWQQPTTLCDNQAHLALLDAFRARDCEGAVRLMRAHIDALLADLDFAPRPRPLSGLAQALSIDP